MCDCSRLDYKQNIEKGGDMLTNTKALLTKIALCGLKQKYVAQKLGISYQSYRRKINNQNEFTASEIVALSETLNLTAKERDAIFFNKVVDKNETK